MARPQKKGLDYFPLDVHFYGDIKVRKLMRSNGGGKAAFVYVILLCKIYESGYYMLWDDDLSFMLSDITGFEEGMIRETIKSCLKLDLLDKEMFEDHHILTSRSIQSRYLAAVRRRVGSIDRLPYIYPDLSKEFLPTETAFLPTETGCNKRFMSAETPLLSTETTFLSTENTQKESKGNDKSSLRSDLHFPPSSSPPTTRVRESEKNGFMSTETAFLSTETPSSPSPPVDVGETVAWLKGQRDWLLQMQQLHGIDVSVLQRWLDVFVNECACRGKQEHDSISDVMQHFNDWLKIKLDSKRKAAKKNGRNDSSGDPPDPRKLWMKCLAELCRAVSAEESAQTFSLMRFESYDPKKGTLMIQVPMKDVYERLEKNHVPLLSKYIFKYFGRVKLSYHIVRDG